MLGSICALEFLRRVDSKSGHSKEKFDDLVAQTFDRTIKEYLELERKYDEETEHRMNFQKQLEWDAFIYEKLIYYTKVYDYSVNRFVKLC